MLYIFKVKCIIQYCETASENKFRWKTQNYRDATSFIDTPTSLTYLKENEEGKPVTTEYGLCTYEDHQTVSIQDMPERSQTGTIPRSVECILDCDLVDSCKCGDRVQMIGVYRTLAGKISGVSRGEFRTVLIVNHIKQILQKITPTTGDEIKLIKKIAKRKNVFQILSSSIANSIYGYNEIKKALILMLLGGSEKNLENGTHIRGDINILMVGDPSTAKSQILRSIINIAPLTISTTGRGASGVGLTASVTQDRDSGERHLEAGAMVLADRGIICIDEFDKMSDIDRVTIHEAMEQQTITISKAGIHTSLNARCSVIAASNPIYGRYNFRKQIHENISFPDSLLSRFDLLFIIFDKLDKELDREISNHVLNLHMTHYKHSESNLFIDMEDSDEKKKEEKDIWIKKLIDVKTLHKNKNKRYLKLEFCKKYIRYCKEKCKPKLTNEASELMAEKYAKLREQEKNSTIPITARCFETLIRLSTAHAKLRLSKLVQKKDIIEVMKILRYSLTINYSINNTFDKNKKKFFKLKEFEEEKSEKKKIKKKKNYKELKFIKQKKMITKALVHYFKKFKPEEGLKLKRFINYISTKNQIIEETVLIKILVQLDNESKIFYVANNNVIHKI